VPYVYALCRAMGRYRRRGLLQARCSPDHVRTLTGGKAATKQAALQKRSTDAIMRTHADPKEDLAR
jgi:hypothetical protein